jgi:hypothetical protein
MFCSNRFFWPLAKAEIGGRALEVLVKNQVGMFTKGRVNKGALRIDLSKLADLAAAPVTNW